MRKITAFVLLFAMLLFSACAPQEESEDALSIVASFYPVYIFTMNLLDGVEGCELLAIGKISAGCLHEYQLTTRDMRLLADCDLFVINGAEMETFIEKAMSEAADLNIVDSSQGIALLEGACGDSGHDHEHEINSHIWLSVPNAVKQVENICAGLLELLPEQAQRIETNRDAYIAKLEVLHNEISAAMANVDSPVITFHSAYDYFVKEYGFDVLACIESDDGGEPSAMELAQLAELINGNGVTALFVEPEYEGSAAAILANETGAEVYVLNPVTSGDAVLTAYEDIMRQNLETIFLSQQ